MRGGGDRAASALALVAITAAASAAEITWFGPNGLWSNAANWYPNQLPAAGDLVWVKASSGHELSVGYASAAAPWLDTVHFDSVGSGIAIVGVTKNLLHVGHHTSVSPVTPSWAPRAARIRWAISTSDSGAVPTASTS